MHYDSPRWSGASSKMFITRAIEYTLSGKRNRTSCDVRSAGNHELDPQLGLSKHPRREAEGWLMDISRPFPIATLNQCLLSVCIASIDSAFNYHVGCNVLTRYG